MNKYMIKLTMRYDIKYTCRLRASKPYRAPPPQNCRGWVHFFRIGV